METPVEGIIKYYASKESKLGYKYIMWDSKHLGFYPSQKADITEKEAQVLYQDYIAKSLNLKSDELVMDAGCGRGVVACYLAEKYKITVTGVDITPFEIENAVRRASRLNIQNSINFIVSDYSETELENNYFDALYANETLSHAPNLLKTFSEFYRVLKPGGRISIIEYVIANDEEFSEREMETLNFIIDKSAMVGLKQFRKNKIIPILEEVGFINCNQKDITKFGQPSFQRLHRIAKLAYPFVKFFGLQGKFINTTSAAEMYPWVEKELIFLYNYTADKPQQ